MLGAYAADCVALAGRSPSSDLDENEQNPWRSTAVSGLDCWRGCVETMRYFPWGSLAAPARTTPPAAPRVARRETKAISVALRQWD
jgi:hypothetical protein